MAITESHNATEGVPAALRPGPHERVPSLVFVEATARSAMTRAKTQRRKPIPRSIRPRRITTAPTVKPVNTASPFSPRPESPTVAFSPLELLFSGTPLPSPYSVDSLKSIDSVLSLSVRSVDHAPFSGGDVTLVPLGVVVRHTLEGTTARTVESGSNTPIETPSSGTFPLAAKTFCDFKIEHERYARALLRVASLGSEHSDPTKTTSVITRSSTSGSRNEGATISALSVIRFARAPSRIPRLQQDSSTTSRSSSQPSRTSSTRKTASDISVKIMIDDADDIFKAGSKSAGTPSPVRQNAFSKALGQPGLSVVIDSPPRKHLHPELPALDGDIADLATADSYLAALEALLGVTPPRPTTVAMPELATDFSSDSEYSMTPTINVHISAKLSKVAARDGNPARQVLKPASLSHIIALEAHLEALAARIPSVLDSEALDTQGDAINGDQDIRMWLVETSGAQEEGQVYLPRLEAHLEGLLARVEQKMLPIDSPVE